MIASSYILIIVKKHVASLAVWMIIWKSHGVQCYKKLKLVNYKEFFIKWEFCLIYYGGWCIYKKTNGDLTEGSQKIEKIKFRISECHFHCLKKPTFRKIFLPSSGLKRVNEGDIQKTSFFSPIILPFLAWIIIFF